MSSIDKTTIPKGWKEVKLRDVCVFERGIEPGTKNYNSLGNGRRFIRVADLTETRNGKVYTEIETDKIAAKNDILLSLDGSIGVVRRGFDGIYSTGIRKASFKNLKNNTNDFLYYLLQGEYVQKIILEYAIGSTIKHAGKSINFMEVSIPESKQEQQKIAKILSAVDEDIEKTDEIIKETERLKKGLMQDLLTGGRHGRNANCRNANRRNAKFCVPTGKRKFKKTKLGKIPEGWEVKDLIDVATLQRGFDLPIQNRICGEYPMATSNGITDYHNEYKILGPGVFTGRSGTIGNVFYIEKNYWPHNTTLYVKDFHGNNKKFIYYLLHQFNLKSFYSGTGVPTLNRNIVHKEKIAIPKSKAEQKQIADILSEVDNKIEINKQIKNKLTLLKKGLMQDLLSGRMRVK